MLEDIGLKFGSERTFSFDIFAIDEILFDDTDDITLYCRVPYFGVEYFATFGLTFAQLNTILRSIRSGSGPIATALADKLNNLSEVPTTIRIEDVYNMPLEVNSVVLHTTLYELTDEDEEDDNSEEDGEGNDEYVAYAFLVDEVELIPPLS